MDTTSIYFPNTAGGDAWYGNDTDPVNSALGDWKDTDYTAGEEDDVSVDNASNVAAQGFGPNEWPGHMMQYDIVEAEGDVTRLDVTCKFREATGGTYMVLYIWRDTGSHWELLDDTTTGPPGVTYTLSGAITADQTDYVSAGGLVLTLLTHQTGNPGNIVYLYYQELQVTV